VLKKVSLVRCRVSGYIFDNNDGGMVEVMDLRYTTGEVEKVMGRVAGMRNVTELYLCKIYVKGSGNGHYGFAVPTYSKVTSETGGFGFEHYQNNRCGVGRVINCPFKSFKFK
jgi:hypothetical protein